MKFNIEDFENNPQKYIGARIKTKGLYFDSSSEIYIAKIYKNIPTTSVGFLYKTDLTGIDYGHGNLWASYIQQKNSNSLDILFIKNIEKFPYGKYKSRFEQASFIQEFFNSSQLEFDF